jgi:hypothetical protein
MTIRRVRAALRGDLARGIAALLAGLLISPGASWATQEAPPAGASQQAAPAAAPEEAPRLSNDELDSLVAPVALYPDPLLAQLLVASTYPLDIMEAQQWVGKNPNLKGDELTKEAEKQGWDASIAAMVGFPDVLKRMSENVKWTTDLGNAFLAQQTDVMDAVQRLRVRAKDNGKLESNEQQKVETKVVESKTIVEIQPAKTEVVYVPSYSPTVVWGAPPYPYPPMYYPPYYPGAAFVSFGVGMAVGAAISGGWGWGCGWGGNNTININNNNTFVNNSNRQNNVNRSGNSNWSHNSKQRGGVPYKDKATANKYGGGARGDSLSSRQQQARSRESGASRSGGSRGGGSSNLGSRGGAGASTMSSRGGGSGNFGGTSGSRAGSRDVSSSGRSRSSSSAFGGSGSSGSRARASSSRGSSSMSGSRGGGGGRRR